MPVPRGRYQQKQWEDRQAAILDALEALSTERGFANVTMDDVANEVGISKATLYQHFDSKDSMLVHLMAQHEDRFIAWLDSTSDQPPVERLRQTMRHLMEGRVFSLRGLVRLGREDVVPIFRRSPDLVERHDQIVQMLTAIVAQGQAEGTIAPDLTPLAVISAMLTLSNVSMGGYEPSGCSAATDHEGCAEQMIVLFERAIHPV